MKQSQAIEEVNPVPTEKPHPLRKIPGISKSRCTWSKYQGRWVVPAPNQK